MDRLNIYLWKLNTKHTESDVIDIIDGDPDELGLGGGVKPPSEWNPSSTCSVSITEDERLQELGTFNVSLVWK